MVPPYCSVGLVGLRLDHLLHYPILDDAQAVEGPVTAIAKCQAGTAAWQAFQSGRPVYGGNAPAGTCVYADWGSLPSGDATVVTVPIDTSCGLVGTGTFATAQGAVLDLASICWFVALLGQCLAHCKCQVDLQVAMSHATPANSKPHQSKESWRRHPSMHAGVVRVPGSRTFAHACQVCSAINLITVAPADLGLQAVVAHPATLPAAGPKITPASVSSHPDAMSAGLQQQQQQHQLANAGQQSQQQHCDELPILGGQQQPADQHSTPSNACRWLRRQSPAMVRTLTALSSPLSASCWRECLHALQHSGGHWQHFMRCCCGVAGTAAQGICRHLAALAGVLGLWMLAQPRLDLTMACRTLLSALVLSWVLHLLLVATSRVSRLSLWQASSTVTGAAAGEDDRPRFGHVS